MKLFCLLLSLLLATSVHGKSGISHIVVLMMENRSFDHLLGWLKRLNPKIDGLVDGMSVPRDPNDLSKGTIPVNNNGYNVAPDDPLHDFNSIATQIDDDAMDGFILTQTQHSRNESNPVSMFDETSAPIINQLAQEFAVFDRWFCSIPSSTDPNRQFAMSGTSLGILTNFNGTLYPQQSYFDYLRKNNRSFAGYYQDDLWALGYFEDLVNPSKGNHQYVKQLEPNFYNDVASGNLADYVWLQPRTSAHLRGLPTWQHPDAPVIEGERLIKQVYEALRAGPKWEETLFLITYDEHGGFYDHVAPPRGVPSPDDIPGSNGFQFDQLGLRIPTLAISPRIAKGTVVNSALPGEQPTATSAFDSTSIMATANILLGLTEEGVPALGKRMAWANTFSTLINGVDAPRTGGKTSPFTYCALYFI